MIRDRVQKICDSFMGSRFDVPSLGDQLFDQLKQVRFQITEDRELLRSSKSQLRQYLTSINGNCNEQVPSQLEVIHNHIVKEKSIYNVINMLQARNSNYIGFLWSAVEYETTNYAEMAKFNGVEF